MAAGIEMRVGDRVIGWRCERGHPQGLFRPNAKPYRPCDCRSKEFHEREEIVLVRDGDGKFWPHEERFAYRRP